MVDKLVAAFQKFNLSLEQIEGMDLNPTDIEPSVEERRLSLVGKVVGKKIVNFMGMKNFTSHV